MEHGEGKSLFNEDSLNFSEIFFGDKQQVMQPIKTCSLVTSKVLLQFDL